MSDKDSYAMGFGFLCFVGYFLGWMSLWLSIFSWGMFFFLVPPLFAVGLASGLGGVIRSQLKDTYQTATDRTLPETDYTFACTNGWEYVCCFMNFALPGSGMMVNSFFAPSK